MNGCWVVYESASDGGYTVTCYWKESDAKAYIEKDVQDVVDELIGNGYDPSVFNGSYYTEVYDSGCDGYYRWEIFHSEIK